MIERLQRALEHLDELPPSAQEEIATEIEERTSAVHLIPSEARQTTLNREDLPQTVRDALAVAGVARDLQDDDEFAALDRIRHESVPTPPIKRETRGWAVRGSNSHGCYPTGS